MENDKEIALDLDIDTKKYTAIDENYEYKLYTSKKGCTSMYIRSLNIIKAVSVENEDDHVVLTLKGTQTVVGEDMSISCVDAEEELYIPVLSKVTSQSRQISTNTVEFKILKSDLSNGGTEVTRTFSFYVHLGNSCSARIYLDKSIVIDDYMSFGPYNELLITVPPENEETPKIKVAVLGSCYSRRAFTSTEYYNPDYKRKYQVVCTQFQSSIIAIMNQFSLSENEKIYSGKHFSEELVTKLSFENNFFKRLLESQPDILLIDLWGDSHRGILKVGKKNIFTSTPVIQENQLVLNEDHEVLKLTAETDFEEYFHIFKESLAQFTNIIENYLPKTHIIINEFACNDMYYDENRELQRMKNKRNLVKRRNMFTHLMTMAFIESVPESKLIKTKEYRSYADIESPGTFSVNHMESAYYKRFMSDVDTEMIKLFNC